jgi:hypothetical protein
MKDRLQQLAKTVLELLRRIASNTLTLQEESALYLALVGLSLYGIGRMIGTLTDSFLIATNASSHLNDPLASAMLVLLMAISGFAGLIIGAISTVLWIGGRDIRRRGGLWALASAKGSSTPTE